MTFLLTGGSACGKSTYAENLICRMGGPRYYIATMRPFGTESERKIARHRRLRADKGFVTIERHTNLMGLTLPERGAALLECMCNLTANEMFDEAGNYVDVRQRVLEGVFALADQCEHLAVVTNDVGSDLAEYDPGTAAYIRALGDVNRALAEKFDNVYELVCGIPLVLKGALL